MTQPPSACLPGTLPQLEPLLQEPHAFVPPCQGRPGACGWLGACHTTVRPRSGHTARQGFEPHPSPSPHRPGSGARLPPTSALEPNLPYKSPDTIQPSRRGFAGPQGTDFQDPLTGHLPLGVSDLGFFSVLILPPQPLHLNQDLGRDLVPPVTDTPWPDLLPQPLEDPWEVGGLSHPEGLKGGLKQTPPEHVSPFCSGMKHGWRRA